jgi:hypothetical protein
VAASLLVAVSFSTTMSGSVQQLSVKRCLGRTTKTDPTLEASSAKRTRGSRRKDAIVGNCMMTVKRHKTSVPPQWKNPEIDPFGVDPWAV